MREQTQQIPGGNRLSLRTGFEDRCNTAPDVEKQFLQRREDFLHAIVDLRVLEPWLGVVNRTGADGTRSVADGPAQASSPGSAPVATSSRLASA